MSKCPKCGSGLFSDQDGYAKCVNPKCGWTEWGATHSSPVRSKKMSREKQRKHFGTLSTSWVQILTTLTKY